MNVHYKRQTHFRIRIRRRYLLVVTSVVALACSTLGLSSAGAQGVLCGGLEATIVGTGGDDVLVGTDGPDVIFAAQGNDRISALGGDDVICAGKGNDIVEGGQGFDIIFGAQGHDVLYATTSRAWIDPAARADTRGARMFGGAGDDMLFGSNRWDRMQGGIGLDLLEGFDGRDWLRGGADVDVVNGGQGIDDVHGGNGSDRLSVTTGDIVRGGAGPDWCVIVGAPAMFRSCGENRYEPGGKALTLPAGTYRVGTDVPHGWYRTNNGYELNRSDGGQVGYRGIDDGPTIAAVFAHGDTVTFNTPATRLDTSNPISIAGRSKGRAAVGLDLEPGRYRLRVDPAIGFGTATRLDGRGQSIGGIAIATEPGVIDIPAETVFVEWQGFLERID